MTRVRRPLPDSKVQNLIVWASGMIEFIGDRPEPDGAILVCTAKGQDAIEFLFDAVRENSVLHDFGGRVALRVPEINMDNPDQHEAMACEQLMIWGDYLRDDVVGPDSDFEWTRPHAR